MIRFGIDKDPLSPGQVQIKSFRLIFYIEAKCLPVEIPAFPRSFTENVLNVFSKLNICAGLIIINNFLTGIPSKSLTMC